MLEKNRNGGVHRHTNPLNSLINFYGLRELNMSGGIYTWSNNQEPPTLVKLDRILITSNWEDIFPQATVKKLPREVSDHNPLILFSGQCKKSSHIQFKFELSWIDNPDFIQGVGKIWEKPCKAKTPLDKIQQKLKLVKQYFKGWGFNLQGELRKKRKIIQGELSAMEEIEEIVGLSPYQIGRKVDILTENMKLLLHEESYIHTGIIGVMKIGSIKVTLIPASFINVPMEDVERQQYSVWKKMA